MEVIDLSREKTILNRYVREIRDVEIQKDSMRFRRNLERIGEIMAYRVSERLAYHEISVQTSLAVAQSVEPAEKVVLGTILRASLPMHAGCLNVFDDADNAFITAYRKYTDGDRFEVVVDYVSTPKTAGRTLLLIDTMLASGESIVATYKAICGRAGTPSHTHIITALAAVQGINYLRDNLLGGNITVWCATIDTMLNEHSYIVPGLGDAGDLAFGEKI